MQTVLACIARALILAALAGASFSAPATARADAAWPSKPLHLIVPGGPGGVIDVRARFIAERLAKALGQPVIVENRSGAGGNIGMEAAARSAPDGNTLVVVHQGTMTMNPHLYSHAGYDPLRDFVPITRIGVGPLLLAVNPAVPAHSLMDLVRLAKAHPGELSFGSPGVGTPPHIASELFLRMAGITAVHVPYRGGGQAVADLMAGHVAWSIEGLTVQLPQVVAGHLRALAVTGPKRTPSLPDVPTFAEAGISGYEFTGWVGLAAPAQTPPAIVDRLFMEVARILATDEARAWFASFDLTPGGETPEEFARLIGLEHARWGRLIREAGIRAD